jgi:uncharacterized protein YbjT (DUF2867 family)
MAGAGFRERITMFAVLGATGKVGRTTIEALRRAGKPVRAIIRDGTKAEALSTLGCEIAIADLRDVGALTRALDGAGSAQVICPTEPTAPEAEGEMRRSIEAVAQALDAARPELVLAISDYGAQVESGTGITMLYRRLEERLGRVKSRMIFLRSAEHMENWTRLFAAAARTGVLPSLHHPLDKLFPTVSAHDVGAIAADLLLAEGGRGSPHIVHVEGPRRYTPADVARTMAELAGREIRPVELPRPEWGAALERGGLSASYADLVTELYEAHNAGRIDAETSAGPVLHGKTELDKALRRLLP